MKSYSDSYKAAGVDVTAGYKAVELMKAHIAKTMIPGVMSGIGGFGGAFELDLEGIKKPVLVSGTDGVGTKLKLAFLLDKHDTIGIDAVAMCVNDIVCCGARPLFFLDYIAQSKVIPEKVEQIVKGIAEGCVMAGAALIGGETAEMPGFYAEGEYDIAGFSVGVVDKEKIVDSSRLAVGDVLIGIASSGVHSNGFSLVRKVFGLDDSPKALERYIPELSKTLGEALLCPTKIYVKPMLGVIEKCDVKAVSHITGGGFYENIPRMLGQNQTARIKKSAVPALPLFELIAKEGSIPERDMFNTFNMGFGMIFAVPAAEADKAIETLAQLGEKGAVLGEIAAGDEGVVLW